LASLAPSDFGVKELPHSGQKFLRTRMDTPQKGQRRAISGSGIKKISDFGFLISNFELEDYT
jgi:hypothetical protein